MNHYMSDGKGRDTYVSIDSGGLEVFLQIQTNYRYRKPIDFFKKNIRTYNILENQIKPNDYFMMS